MEIVKLEDICEIKTGNKNKEDESNYGKYPFYTRSTKILKSDDYTIDYKSTIIPGEGVFIPLFNEGKAAVHQRVYIIKAKKEYILDKYLYYWWFLNKNILYKEAVGSTVKSLRKSNFEKPKINLPSIIVQKAIIDIIEPFELKLSQIKNKLTHIENITNQIINYDYKIINLFKDEEILFSKGINFKKGMISERKTNLLFINVASINNNPNKYINEEFLNLKNVEIGDVILSLDGNTGLVNNFLTGINGYGYKIVSNKYSNFQLYYSLLSKINQDIIKQNSHGTTIKHASKAKDQILLLDFKNNNLLKSLYELDIKYKEISKKLTKIINLLIEFYVN